MMQKKLLYTEMHFETQDSIIMKPCCGSEWTDIRELILNQSFKIPKISFNFIPTKAMELSYKYKFQEFGVIIWCQFIIKRNMKH